MQKKHYCHDCKVELKKGDFCYSYKANEKEFAKCEACHKIDATLRNFQITEVYSRVVGYIRPVSQWNKGKQAEFGDRNEYVIDNGSCATC
jgi:anaerobic ribonucleoside-triphosphate reductase